MKRIAVLSALIVTALAGCVYASPEYPALGICTGDGVRLRESPGTSSKILGKVNAYQQLVLLGERRVKSDTWYRADNPFDDGEAWISGRYVEKRDGDAVFRTALAVRMNFGMTPKKARMIFGRPSETERTKFFFDPAQKNYTREILTYPGFTISFTEGKITRVEVTKKGYAFGEIEIGEAMQIVLDTLGKPASSKNSRFTYEISPVEVLTFEYKSDRDNVDRVTRMCWEEYLDG
ncbi:MAG: SH3 domain-containing protein [Synergistaceae bacterium]|nr:SH3 domain-containing protein [Synergistaceae bacterium]